MTIRTVPHGERFVFDADDDVVARDRGFDWFVTGILLVGWTEETVRERSLRLFVGKSVGPALELDTRQLVEHQKRKRTPYPLSIFVPRGSVFQPAIAKEAGVEVHVFWERA